MKRRKVLLWLSKAAGGYFGAAAAGTIPQLLMINTVRLGEAQAQTGNDVPGLCPGEFCPTDGASGPCVTDTCATRDKCEPGDAGHTCYVSDTCDIDESGDCRGDACTVDSSGACSADTCATDNSGGCISDSCTSDKSGKCRSDVCVSDSSGDCSSDQCNEDKSGACAGDSCDADNSGNCSSDQCNEDRSGACRSDRCNIDKSAPCTGDVCVNDSSGDCIKDVCVVDNSGSCDTDLCRQDSGGPCSSDVCASDITPPSRADAGMSRALRWLYRVAMLLLALNLAPDDAFAATVIDASDAMFGTAPSFQTAQTITVPNPMGAFIRDCDGDGIDEADTNGDGNCAGDPKLLDYNGDGSRELPAGTPFSGTFQFRCVGVSSDIALVTTGPVALHSAGGAGIYGAVFAAGDFALTAIDKIDLKTSSWMADEGRTLTFRTGLAGVVDQAQHDYSETGLPNLSYAGACGATPGSGGQPIPSVSAWGLVFLLLVLSVVAWRWGGLRKVRAQH